MTSAKSRAPARPVARSKPVLMLRSARSMNLRLRVRHPDQPRRMISASSPKLLGECSWSPRIKLPRLSYIPFCKDAKCVRNLRPAERIELSVDASGCNSRTVSAADIILRSFAATF